MMVEFHVLKCSDCQTFQVLQVTKSQKWKCKLCGNKQSVIKVYGVGTGADCRKHVQKLNTFRGELDQVKEDALFQAPITTALLLNNSNAFEKKQTSTSQWAKFISEEADHVSDDENDNTNFVDDSRVTTDRALYEAEQKQAKINKKRMNCKEDYYSQCPSFVKRFREPNERMGKKHFVTSASASSGHNFLPAMQSSSFQSIQDSDQGYPLFNRLQERETPQTVLMCPERDRYDRMKNIFGGEIRPQREETPRNENTKRASPKSCNTSLSTQEDNVLKNNGKAESKFHGTKTKKSDGTAWSSKPSKWATFLDDDQDENDESDEDIDLSQNDCGQLTVCLPDSDSSKSLFHS